MSDVILILSICKEAVLKLLPYMAIAIFPSLALANKITKRF